MMCRGVAEFVVGMVVGNRGDSYLRASPLAGLEAGLSLRMERW